MIFPTDKTGEVYLCLIRKVWVATMIKNSKIRDFPSGTAVKNPPANAGDTGSSPGLGRSHMPWSN